MSSRRTTRIGNATRIHPSTMLLAAIIALIVLLGGLFLTPWGRVGGSRAANAAATPPPTVAAPTATRTPTATPTDTASASATETAQQRALPATTTVDLDASLAAALPTPAGGNLSVAILDTASGRRATAGAAGHMYATASIVKVDILAALLLEAQQQGRGLTADERTSATAMIEQSDNDAADALWADIGGAAGLNAANAVFGLTSTTPGTDTYWGLTTTTPDDQLHLLSAVTSDSSVLNSDARTYLLDLMGSVDADQAWGVSAADEAGPTALKNGWLPRADTGLWVVNSIGRVTRGGRQLLVVVLSDGQASMDAGVGQVEAAAKAATSALVTALASV